MEKYVRYFHKDGMAIRENNEWVVDPLYQDPITLPFRGKIEQRKIIMPNPWDAVNEKVRQVVRKK